MATASAGADAAAAANAKLAGKETDYLTQAHDTLFGSDGKSGSLTKFTDPASLNVSSPTGPYGLQYNKAIEGISQNSANARGSLSRYMASRGFGNAPSGFQADELRKSLADETNQKGAAFTDFTGKSYQDALSNFWNANNLMAGQGANSTSAAVQANNSAASNYSNLYGTASTPVPSALGGIVGGGLQAGATVGTAAMCPCVGAHILMHGAGWKLVEELRKGDLLKGIDGNSCILLEDPQIVERDAVEIHGMTRRTRVSAEHTFVLNAGGYEFAPKVAGKILKIEKASELIAEVKDIGTQKVAVLEIGGSHTYCADGFWGLM